MWRDEDGHPGKQHEMDIGRRGAGGSKDVQRLKKVGTKKARTNEAKAEDH